MRLQQQLQAVGLLVAGFVRVVRISGPILVGMRQRIARRDDPADMLNAVGEQIEWICQVFKNLAEDRLIAARKTLEYQATRDELTGIWNRRAILDHLNRELHRSRRNGEPVSIAMIDIDHFNVSMTHMVTCLEIRRCSKRLKSCKPIFVPMI